ncbi:ATP-binding protein [Enterobacter cloacae complex sp. P29RS]|uniref:ATP-binding protein n=1 Tax=Enterobacter cloacae complex sp. P29RS TaxID=2779563 RepID=UPI001867D6D5|nr:ATP-binding protein [Enterobacter cloacae complex sp. P29RS]MBE3176066.1 ATP-binding protein [Enterobacter cloacae complex sp. P29RS]
MAKIKTKARALDMLGRQQIAGIPTALSELFKNAHDAYADNVEVDYIRKKNLLILRDNGLGMSRDDFEERWLTIGTDSKFIDEDSIGAPTTDDKKKKRPIMGEKGIGRLAIAAIGPQVLVITRSRKNDILGNIVVSFVNWTLFSLPKLNLEDIDIPIIELNHDESLNKKHIDNLISQALKNVNNLTGKISQNKIEQLIKQIEYFDYDPEFWSIALDNLDKQLNLIPSRPHLNLENESGTHFIIAPVDDILSDEVEGFDTKKRTDQASRLEKALLGFTNTMYEHSQVPIIARFRDHTLHGECIDRISESVFFTPEEFSIADHHFNGNFNEFGQFEGTIKIYGEEKSIVVPWAENNNKEVLCGPFNLNLAYIHGTQRDSKLSPEIWQDLRDKTDKFGGLYIYRDGIRILPYGDSDFDFLRIEQRRSKSLKEYFFSYRRMFGAIELTKEFNCELKEKAGREGFIENKAYKQLKAILENFFISIASDFFNDKSELAATFIETRARQQREYELLKKREKLKTTKRKNFEAALNKFFTKLDEGKLDSSILQSNNKLDTLFNNFNQNTDSIDDLAFSVESVVNNDFGKLINDIEINKPTGIGLNKNLADQWDLYQVRKNELINKISNVKNNANKILVSFEEKYGDRTGLRRRFNDSLVNQDEYQRKLLNEAFNKATSILEDLQQQVKKMITHNREVAKKNTDEVFNAFNSTSFQGVTVEQLYRIKNELETKSDNSSSMVIENINLITERLLTAKEDSEQNITSSSELVSVLESEYEHIKEQNDRNLHLAQIGMAVGIINHEFNHNVLSIRRGLNEMQVFANRSENFRAIYDRVRSGFDHLDAYLKTFTPLTRSQSRRRTTITGKALSEFIESVFDDRFKKEEVRISYTSSFINQSIQAYTSTIYSVFINLIDNAIYWVSKGSADKSITLDASKNGFKIMDSGPGIPTIDHENVFEFGFGRRIGGQGMGLYIARQTLQRDGFDITLESYQPNTGAVFIIEPIQDKE